MLDILRKKASSWMTKFILGMIIVVFALYFGFTSLQQGPQVSTLLAEVDGVPIYQSEVNRLVQNQMNIYQQIYPDEIPDSLIEQLRSQALNRLIEDRILRSEAISLGFRVSDDEVYKALSSDPNLQVNGVFDAERYRTVIRPFYRQRYGIDYEEVLREGLLVDKFRDLFSKAVIISENEVKNSYRLENTKIKIKSIEINPAKLKAESPTDKEEEAGPATETDIMPEDRVERARELAEELWPDFIKNKNITDRLEKNNLKERESPPTPLSRANTLFGGQNNLEAVSTLFQLDSKNPFPEKPLQVGNSFYLVKLLEKSEPSWDDFNKRSKEIQEKSQRELANQFYRRWYQEKLKHAKIKIPQQ